MSCTITNSYDICILQNASFELNFKLFDDGGSGALDVTSWSFEAGIKEKYDDVVPILFLTASVESYTTASINLYLGSADTWRLSGSTKFVYDVIAHNPTVTPPDTYRLIQGKVSVNKGVTAP